MKSDDVKEISALASVIANQHLQAEKEKLKPKKKGTLLLFLINY
jgi:hypothetical protein